MRVTRYNFPCLIVIRAKNSSSMAPFQSGLFKALVGVRGIGDIEVETKIFMHVLLLFGHTSGLDSASGGNQLLRRFRVNNMNGWLRPSGISKRKGRMGMHKW